jgi:hypothetical protein
MLNQIIAIYAITDDLLKAISHPEDCRRVISDAEVLTTAMCAARFFGGNQEQARLYMKEHGLIPKMISKSRLNRRLHSVAHDLRGLKLLPLNLPPGSQLYADKAYSDYQIEDNLQLNEQIQLQAIPKQNSHRFDPPWTHYYKQTTRHYIETVFSQITLRFPKSLHAVTLKGFLFKVFTFIFAYTLERAFL